MSDVLSQFYSNAHTSTAAAQQGSTGTRTPPQGQQPREDIHCHEKKEDRMNVDLLYVGSKFESNK